MIEISIALFVNMVDFSDLSLAYIIHSLAYLTSLRFFGSRLIGTGNFFLA